MKGDRCFCAQRPEILKRLLYDLRFLGIDTDEEMKRGALEVHTEEETYFPNKRFEPSAMMEMLARSIEESRARGFAAFRSAGELGWAVRGRNACDRIIDYEKMVEEYYPGKPAIGLCQYDMKEFPPAVLDAVLENHRMHLDQANSSSLHSSIDVRYGACSVEVVVDKHAGPSVLLRRATAPSARDRGLGDFFYF